MKKIIKLLYKEDTEPLVKAGSNVASSSPCVSRPPTTAIPIPSAKKHAKLSMLIPSPACSSLSDSATVVDMTVLIKDSPPNTSTSAPVIYHGDSCPHNISIVKLQVISPRPDANTNEVPRLSTSDPPRIPNTMTLIVPGNKIALPIHAVDK